MYWLAVGPPENVRIGLEHGGFWGFPGRYKWPWSKVEKDDVVLLYATAPVRGVVAFGKVILKERGTSPLWPDEMRTGEVLWPLRLKFTVGACLPYDKWNSERIQLLPGQANVQRSFQRMNEGAAVGIIQALSRELR